MRYKRIKQHKDLNYVGIFNDGKTIRITPDTSRAISPLPFPELEDVSLTSKCLAGCSYCFLPGTKVNTSKGLIPIEEISIGDLVFTSRLDLNKVDQLHSREYNGPIITIHTEDNKIISCTPEHTFHTATGEKKAKDLTPDDFLIDL